MIYLFGQLLFWLLAAFALGLMAGWLYMKMSSMPESEDKNREPDNRIASSSYTLPITQKDDLKKISGIGSRLEQLLNGLGVYTFEQVANFSKQDIEWISERLYFSDRIEREQWVEQARQLARGQETEFSRRIDSGDVTYEKT